MSNKITFLDDGRIVVEDNTGRRFTLSLDEVWHIDSERELRCVTEDIKGQLAERYEGGKNPWDYDAEKYPPDVVRSLATEVIVRENDSETRAAAYRFIVDWVLDDYDEGALTV